MPRAPRPAPPSTAPPRAANRHWLLFAHQLPAKPSNLRVRTWRRLQQLGAIPVKQGLYVLPDTATAREDFEWLKSEIVSARGDANVFAADTVDAWSDDALVQEFGRVRQEAYGALAEKVERVLARLDAPRRRSPARTPALGRVIEGFQLQLAAIEGVDFFGTAGRDRVVTLLERLKARVARKNDAAGEAADRVDADQYRARLWVTRPRPGVDRMASAWLIRRFVDPGARFGFVADREAAVRDAVPFDMFGVEFTHRGEHCTFETLCASFGIRDAAVNRIAGIVHDLDLKDRRFGAPEAPAVGTVIDGLQRSFDGDERLLEEGIVLFEALYRAFAHQGRRVGPRPTARRRGGASSRSRR
jgi:hypothetical protein